MTHPASSFTAPVITTPAPLIHDTARPVSTDTPKLWDRIAIACRARHFSLSTERSYVHWAKRLALFHDKRHPAKLTPDQVQAFLNYLAVDGTPTRRWFAMLAGAGRAHPPRQYDRRAEAPAPHVHRTWKPTQPQKLRRILR